METFVLNLSHVLRIRKEYRVVARLRPECKLGDRPVASPFIQTRELLTYRRTNVISIDDLPYIFSLTLGPRPTLVLLVQSCTYAERKVFGETKKPTRSHTDRYFDFAGLTR